jgi:serine/threonine protein kinase
MADPRETDPAHDPLLGKTLAGRYLIKTLIDRGGMGKVYRAEQQPLGRMVALKTLDLLDPRGEFKERFFNEASVASRLTHPNTVRVFDYGRSDDGTYFITMELLEGQSLQKLVKAEAPLDPLRLIHLIRQVCGALQEAHDQGIVHRDLKPGNIFLTRHGDGDEFVKVLDFGLVKNLESDVSLSQTGQALGSPLYMAPEQVEGEKVDRRSDVYALGLVMYVALSGKVPFKKGSVATIMMQQVTAVIPTFREIAPTVRIHPGFEWIVRRCIEKDRTKRIASMRELSIALKLLNREIRGEIPGPVPWALTAEGTLDLPPELLGAVEETASALRPAIPILPDPPPDPIENSRPSGWSEAAYGDVPSSPTLSRSTTSVAAAGAALAGGGLLVFLLAFAVLGLLLGAFGVYWALTSTATPPPDPVPVERPREPDVPAPAAPSEVQVTVASSPSGAEVLKDGAPLGTTPMTLGVREDQPARVTLRLRGYDAHEVVVDGSVDRLDVPLKPRRGSGPKPPPDDLLPTRVAPAPSPAPAPTVRTDDNDLKHPWEEEG